MIFYDLDAYLRLSAVLNYQLSAKNIDWNNIATILLGDKTITQQDRNIFLQVLEYLNKVYGQKKRRLGPLSVLHPLRATALLSRVCKKPTLLNLMVTLLHDNFEDIKPRKLEISNWVKLDTKFQSFVNKIPETDQWFLMERLKWLTKDHNETYYRYIGRLLDQSQNTPEAVRIKLVDRLDNTLDMRIEFEDPLHNIDFFEIVFQMLFSSSFRGFKPKTPHPPPAALNGAQRLYQLFKNTVLMSLIRQKKAAQKDKVAMNIFNYLARASMKEAQRIVLHIFGYHQTSLKRMRILLIETMEYVQSGGIDSITPPIPEQRLDGLFMSIFDIPKKNIRERKLSELYADKPLMIEAAVAFIVIFLSFINDADYYVRGISADGVSPLTTE
ncbi:HD domain-containing protein [candidate division KSB1 bacterium]|nr:HD domain-containing protein [candidate division KSB1 bacterium]